MRLNNKRGWETVFKTVFCFLSVARFFDVRTERNSGVKIEDDDWK